MQKSLSLLWMLLGTALANPLSINTLLEDARKAGQLTQHSVRTQADFGSEDVIYIPIKMPLQNGKTMDWELIAFVRKDEKTVYRLDLYMESFDLKASKAKRTVQDRAILQAIEMFSHWTRRCFPADKQHFANLEKQLGDRIPDLYSGKRLHRFEKPVGSGYISFGSNEESVNMTSAVQKFQGGGVCMLPTVPAKLKVKF